MSIKFDYNRMKVASLIRKTANGAAGSFSSGGLGANPFSSNAGILPGQGAGGRIQYNPVYDDLSEGTIIEQFMPVDPRRLHRIWRRIYLQDPVAGPIAELFKELPWSDFQLTGIDDKNILQFYTDALNALNITSILPELSAEFITMGKVIGHLHMDERKGYYSKLIVHDPDWIKVSPIPIPGFQPKLDIIPTSSMRKWVMSNDPRDLEAQEEIRELVDLIKNGKEIPLPPEQSFYIPRKTSPYDVIGASAYTRIIMFVAYEKALVNGTIAAAKRRMSRIRHISVGLEDWEPSPQELDGISGLFMQADEDPVGAIVVTRTGVAANEIGGGTPQDIVKISDEWSFLQTGKLNSMGVSESFLTGTASYNTLEQQMSIFLEKVRAHRNFFTYYLLIDRILKPLAQKNQFVKRTTAELNHRVRVGRSETSENLLLPDFKWEKSLRPVADRDYLEILEFMASKGIPVTMRTWAASAGFNLDSEVAQFEDDLEMRKKLSSHLQKIQDVAPETMGAGGMGGGLGGMGGLGGLGSGGPALDLDTGGSPDMGNLDLDTGGAPDLGNLGGPAELPGGGGEGGEEAAPPANISLPTVGASFKAASIDGESIQAIISLPHWKYTKNFLGLELSKAVQYAQEILSELGSEFSTVLNRKKVAQYLDTGNYYKNQVLQYILARAGILHNIQLSADVASDITDKLLELVENKNELKTELRYVYAYSISKPEISENKSKIVNIPEKFSNIIIPGERQGSSLLTGYVDDPRVISNKK